MRRYNSMPEIRDKIQELGASLKSTKQRVISSSDANLNILVDNDTETEMQIDSNYSEAIKEVFKWL